MRVRVCRGCSKAKCSSPLLRCPPCPICISPLQPPWTPARWGRQPAHQMQPGHRARLSARAAAPASVAASRPCSQRGAKQQRSAWRAWRDVQPVATNLWCKHAPVCCDEAAGLLLPVLWCCLHRGNRLLLVGKGWLLRWRCILLLPLVKGWRLCGSVGGRRLLLLLLPVMHAQQMPAPRQWLSWSPPLLLFAVLRPHHRCSKVVERRGAQRSFATIIGLRACCVVLKL